MARREYVITAIWDEDARVWVAESDDVPGLVTEAATSDELLQKLRSLVPELLELNKHHVKDDGSGVPVEILAQFRESISLPN